MASTVIRVKRRITEEPFDKFVLNCKRQKINDDSSIDEIGANAAVSNETDNSNTIVKLAATVSGDDDIQTHLSKLRKRDAEDLATKIRKPTNVIKKLREQFKDDSQNSRFKVINCFRSIDNDLAGSTDGDSNITIVDVIKEDAPLADSHEPTDDASQATAVQNAANFVYDLYLVHSGQQPVEIDISNFTIRPFDDLVYQANDDTLNSDVDSEDSNDEANWRNDYPDTEDDYSIGEEDMRRAVEDMHFDSDGDNRSTSSIENYGEDPVVHFIDGDSDDEYDYFKKHGQVRENAAMYRSNRNRNLGTFDDDSDIDDNPSSASSSSFVSPLASCDEQDDD